MNTQKEQKVQTKKKRWSWLKSFRICTILAAAVVVGVAPFAVAAKSNANQFMPASGTSTGVWAKQEPEGSLLRTNASAESEKGEVLFLSEGTVDAAKVPQVQQRLSELGYLDNDEPTEEYTASIANAVQKFENKHSIEADGVMTDYEYDLLTSDDAKTYSVSLGDEGVDVSELQNRLHELGYLETVTGEFGLYTDTAVKQFQAANGKEQTGEIDRTIRDLLYSDDAVGKIMEIGEQSDDLIQYQQRLTQLGYFTGTANGVYTESFKGAIKRFQQKHAIIADGALGPATKQAILSQDAKPYAYSLGDKGDGVREIQQRLVSLGYLSGATGYYDEQTAEAVKKFQAQHAISADGRVGNATYSKLFSVNAQAYGAQVTPSPSPSVSTKPLVSPSPSGSASAKPSVKPSVKPSTSANPSTSASKPASSAPAGTPATGGPSNSAMVEAFIAKAEAQIGKPYVLGGKGPDNFDCSGFVYWCLKEIGFSQSYMTSYGWKATTKYPIVTKMSELKRGDVISYEGHVGIYLGGNMMIDASSAQGKIRKTSISGSYWTTNFIKGCRLF